MATAAPVQPAAPRRGLKALLARHPLVSFFVMAYVFSWIVWAPLVLGKDVAGLLPINLSKAPGWVSLAFLSAAILAGPTLSAFIMTAMTEGREGVRRLLGRFVLWRVGIRWYLAALVGVPLIKLLSTMVFSGEWPNLGSLGGPSYLLTYLGPFVLTLIIGGPLFEEPGWRGFALPRLERLHGPLVGTLILGVLWALWHLPLFMSPSWAAGSGGGGSIFDIASYVVSVIGLCVVFTWVFKNTHARILLAILVHASNNTASG
jgi:uncharacterized protein